MNSGSNRVDQPDPDAIKMFVGQVPRSMDENELRKMFEEFGPVHQINVLRDKLSGQSRGCCFVTFYKRKDALEAQNALHNIKTMPGMHHAIQMKPADTENRNERKLFVGMLSKKITENDVRAMFSQFGAIEECTVLRDATGTSRGCAFVTYTSRQFAVNAIKNMHHSQTMEGCSSPMVVKFADTQKDKDQKRVQQTTPNVWGIAGLGINGLIPQYLTGIQTNGGAALQPLGGISPLGMQQLLAASTQGTLASAQALQNLAALQTTTGISLANGSTTSASDLSTTTLPNLAALANFSTNSSFPCVTDINAMNMQNLAALAALSGTAGNGALPSIPASGSTTNVSSLASSNGSQLTSINSRSVPATISGINSLGSSPGAGLEALASAYTAAGIQQFTSVFPAFGSSAFAGRTQSGSVSPLQTNQRQQEGPEGSNLFIYHLPQEFGDNDIEQIFLPFGNILSAKVFVDKQTNLSKCFGFVSYDNAMSAQAAIQAMNGFQIGTKRLKVQLKRSKDASKPY